MSHHLDAIPLSGIMRIRDMMFGLDRPLRLDQGDVAFDAPEAVKQAMTRAIADNQTHYVQTIGIPRLRALLADKLRRKNGVPVDADDEIMVTNGGMHGLYVIWQGLLKPADEVVCPDPMWPSTGGTIRCARGVVVAWPLYEDRSWRPDLDELESSISPRTRAILVNSPQNPTGGVLTRADLERIADIARSRDLWVVSDEAYEDVVYDGATHISIASLPGMYDRTIPVYTFSKSYAMTGLRLGYIAVRDLALRERIKKVLYYTCSNVGSVVQHGGIGGLEGAQSAIEGFRQELQARRDLFYQGVAALATDVLTGEPPRGAFYAFLKINPHWRATDQAAATESLSWAFAEYLIRQGRIGCVPGADFGARGEGYVRFCFARGHEELKAALEAMRPLLSAG